jgi:hypothetical protein
MGQCETCKPNTSLDAGACKVSNCKTPVDATNVKCKECNNEYGLTESALCATPKVTNCNTISDADNKKCAVCSDTFSLTEGGACATTVANCKIISDADKTKCAVCSATFGLVEDGKCVTAISGCLTISKDDNKKCKACLAGYSLNATTSLCVATTTTIKLEATVAEDFSVSLNYNCNSENIDVYIAYALGKIVNSVDLAHAKEVLTAADKLKSNEIVGWLQVEDLKKVAKNEKYVLTKAVKNSGADYTVKIFCGDQSATFTFKTKAITTKPVVVTFTSSKDLTAAMKLTMANNIAAFLKNDIKKNPIYADDGQKADKQVTTRRLAATDGKFVVYPDYSANVADTKLDGYATAIKGSTFPAEVVKTLDGVTVTNVKADPLDVNNTPVDFTTALPALTVEETKVSFKLTLSGEGNVIYYQAKLDKKTANTNATYDYDFYKANAKPVNEIKANLTGNDAAISLSNLEKDTSYQIYYYASNNGIPQLYSNVYSQTYTTKAAGLENLKFGFLMLAVLVLALLR